MKDHLETTVDCPKDCAGMKNSRGSNSALSDVLLALAPFAEAAESVRWDCTADRLQFFPVNSDIGGKPITMGAMRIAMETYNKYKSQ